MYKPNSQSAFRVKFDFRVDFTNGGHVEGREFLLDIEGDTVSDLLFTRDLNERGLLSKHA